MPLTLTYTTGTLGADLIQGIVENLTKAMLETHGLAGHPVMTPNVTATVHELPEGRTFSGGKPFSGIWVEWKVPSFAFADRGVQQKFNHQATELLHAASAGRVPRHHIYVNVVHAVDGSWNFNGRALSNQEILAALQA